MNPFKRKKEEKQSDDYIKDVLRSSKEVIGVAKEKLRKSFPPRKMVQGNGVAGTLRRG